MTWCETTTAWIEKSVLAPVTTWVQEQEKRCERWGFFKFICKFVTFLVKVTVWITKTILIPIKKTTCKTISRIVWFMVLSWWLPIFFPKAGLKVKSLLWGSGVAYLGYFETETGYWAYRFKCTCQDGTTHELEYVETSVRTAADLATEECRVLCG